MSSIYPKGFSCYFSWGDNKGLKLLQDGPSYRINLYRLSICIAGIDIEKILDNLVGELRKNDGEKSEIKKLQDRLELDRKVIDSQREKYQEQQKEIERERENTEQVRGETEKRCEELKEEIDRLKKKVKYLEEENEDLNNEITDLNDYSTENEGLKDKNIELENKIKTIDGKKEANIVVIDNLEREIEELNLYKNGIEELHDEFVEEICRLEEENIDLLEEDDEEYEYDLLESSTSSQSSY